ncbi:MAG: type I polyketide synthase, partial [Desulfobacterales bacterium]|nr:type I polyketide synthase [Desulfobacterales bacterium]
MTDQQNFDEEGIDGGDIAIVGIACRFPGADNPGEYWINLRDGHESRVTPGDEELLAAGVTEQELADPDYVKSGMFLDNIDKFDASFFGFSPSDAAIMDPQHRLFLESCWEALENAGHNPESFDGSIGVFGGSGHNAYMPYNLLTNPKLMEDAGFFLVRHTGNDKDFLTTRVSYCLNLTGPSINVQTACSTSLVAAHTACQSLLSGECDMALAGGVTIEMPARRGYLYKENEILSQDGHCRPFDEDSDGTVFGSGVGVVVLRRLEDAIEQGDNIQAVICSSAINNDGAGKVSYLAPSVDGQAAAIIEALDIGEVNPASVTYIECHGTATKMGDPIEVEALTQAYGGDGRVGDQCAIGAVKSNIGHLDTAAGVAGIIKVVQSLKHRQLPPTLHYRKPNQSIDFSTTPFYVNSTLQPWQSEGPLRAGLSSLGVGGTNAHMIFEESPEQHSGESREQQLLVISARSKAALEQACERYAAHLGASEQVLADIAYTAAVGRKAFPFRCCVAGSSAGVIAQALESKDVEKLFFEKAMDSAPDVVFMFAGGGAQYPGMGRDLYDRENVYRETLDECLSAANGLLDFDLRSLLFPDADDQEQAAKALERPSRALPALFCTQYAQARLWQSWGVNARAYIGHSMGEYTAACLAGVFAAKDALAIVAKRGALFEQLESGAMLSVMLPEEKLQSLLESFESLSIAAVNGPELCVASGPEVEIAALTEQLERDDVACQRIHISVAAHSPMLEPILEEFGDFLRSVDFQSPQQPVVSNLTGDWLTDQQARDPNYWVQHLRQTVRFSEGLGLLLRTAKQQILLEVGPGNTLASVSRQQSGVGQEAPVFNSMRHA